MNTVRSSFHEQLLRQWSSSRLLRCRNLAGRLLLDGGRCSTFGLKWCISTAMGKKCMRQTCGITTTSSFPSFTAFCQSTVSL